MRHFYLIPILAAMVGCDIEITDDQPGCPGGVCPASYTDCPYPLLPPADIPEILRVKNYAGGSCVHASMGTCLGYMGHYELAAWWNDTFAGGETFSGLITKADKAGLRWAGTSSGDVGVLDWASRTRRAAVIFYFSAHSITFCGFDSEGYAVLLDNNRTERYIRVPRDEFIQRWKGYGGVAVVPVYSPPAPKPWAAWLS